MLGKIIVYEAPEGRQDSSQRAVIKKKNILTVINWTVFNAVSKDF